MYDWDTRSEMPDLTGDRREQPRLQEHDWVHERRDQQRLPIAIVNAILTELSD